MIKEFIQKAFTVNKQRVMAWALYDWACSVFSSIVMTFIFASYFTSTIAKNQIIGTHEWGNAVALSGIIIAVCSPIFGAIADYAGRRKRWLGVMTVINVLACAGLWFATPSLSRVDYTLTCLVIGAVSFEIAFVFYNALLQEVAPPSYFGRVSGWAWGMGYAGGVVALIIALFGFVQGQPSWLDVHMAEQIRIVGPFTALWFAVFSIPLFLIVKEKPGRSVTVKEAVSQGFRQLRRTLRELPRDRNVLWFLIAQMIYIDGLNTLFAFAGIYAAGTFGMSVMEVVRFGIIANICAAAGAMTLAWVDDYLGPKRTILYSLIGLFCLAAGILLVHSKTLFWIFGLGLSLFVGPIQASSRSQMVRLVPPEKVNELFGLYAFSGKATAFLGPWLLGWVTMHFGSQRMGVSTLLFFFIIGAGILWSKVKVDETAPLRAAKRKHERSVHALA